MIHPVPARNLHIVAILTAHLLAGWAPGLASSQTPSRVSLSLSSAKSEYVVREPVKFVVRLVNDTSQPINISEPNYFDMNMRFFLLEVTTPDGEIQMRKYQYVHSNEIINEKYRGELLAAGVSIAMYLYPNVSYFVRHPRQQSTREGVEVTFPKPGRYTVRVVYVVSTAMENLWKGADGELYSNPVDLVFREPTGTEEEILDALWARGGGVLSVGDNKTFLTYDNDALRSVIDEYPNDPMILHAKLGLARSLMVIKKSTTLAQIEEAREILEVLMREAPGFRPMEVRQHLATTYDQVGRNEDAVGLFGETLRMYPELKDNFIFMQRKIIAETKSVEAISEWRKSRRAEESKNEKK